MLCNELDEFYGALFNGRVCCPLCLFFLSAGQPGHRRPPTGYCCRYPEVASKADTEWCGEWIHRRTGRKFSEVLEERRHEKALEAARKKSEKVS